MVGKTSYKFSRLLGDSDASYMGGTGVDVACYNILTVGVRYGVPMLLLVSYVGSLEDHRNSFLSVQCGSRQQFGAPDTIANRSRQAAFLTAPGNLRAEAAGFKTLLNVRDLFAFPVNGIGLHEQQLKNDRDEVKKVTRALLRANRFILDNPQGAIKILAGWGRSKPEVAEEANTTPRTTAVTSWYPGQPLRMS